MSGLQGGRFRQARRTSAVPESCAPRLPQLLRRGSSDDLLCEDSGTRGSALESRTACQALTTVQTRLVSSESLSVSRSSALWHTRATRFAA